MIDWKRIRGFDWDEGNAKKSVDKHDVSQAEAEQVFFNEPLLVLEDQAHSQAEVRLHALGRTDEKRPLHVTTPALRDGGRGARVLGSHGFAVNLGPKWGHCPA